MKGIAGIEAQLPGPEATTEAGKALGAALQPGDVVLAVGGLGAGKTHFAKGIASALGVEDTVVSPTFNIVLEYEGRDMPLLHLDLYRLEDRSELEDIDFYSLADTAAPHACVIEWADLFPEEMPDDALTVRIDRVAADDADDARIPTDSRRIVATAGGNSSRALLERWRAAMGEPASI